MSAPSFIVDGKIFQEFRPAASRPTIERNPVVSTELEPGYIRFGSSAPVKIDDSDDDDCMIFCFDRSLPTAPISTAPVSTPPVSAANQAVGFLSTSSTTFHRVTPIVTEQVVTEQVVRAQLESTSVSGLTIKTNKTATSTLNEASCSSSTMASSSASLVTPTSAPLTPTNPWKRDTTLAKRIQEAPLTPRRELPLFIETSSAVALAALPFSLVDLEDPKFPPDDITPEQPHNKIDTLQAQAWIAAYPSRQQRLMEKLIRSITSVSHAQFMEALGESTASCSRLLGQEDYIVLVEPNKSNKWVAELAVPDLIQNGNRKPSCVVSLEAGSDGFRKFLNYEAALPRGKGYMPRNVVLFDDGTYSGKQMSKFVFGVLQAYKDQPRATLPKIIVVCPFATDAGKKRILETVLSLSDSTFKCMERFKFISKRRIGMISDDFTRHERSQLTDIFWPTERRAVEAEETRMAKKQQLESMPSPAAGLSSRYTPLGIDDEFNAGPFSRGSFTFAHKIPNGCSFVYAIEHGLVFENGQRARNTAQFSVIPTTIPPYKR